MVMHNFCHPNRGLRDSDRYAWEAGPEKRCPCGEAQCP